MGQVGLVPSLSQRQFLFNKSELPLCRRKVAGIGQSHANGAHDHIDGKLQLTPFFNQLRDEMVVLRGRCHDYFLTRQMATQ